MLVHRCASAILRLLHRQDVQHCFRQRFASTPATLALPSHWGTKKSHRQVQIHVGNRTEEQENALEHLRSSVKVQGDLVRKLKSDGSTDAVSVKKAVEELKMRKQILENMELQLSPTATTFDRFRMDDLLRRRFFYDQSFAIYGGVSGQYDFGPMGCALMSNILTSWRNAFVRADDMLEVECATLTPETVLQTSGHIERFVDTMVKDVETGDCFRLDHLLKQYFENLARTSVDLAVRELCSGTLTKLDGMCAEEMNQLVNTHDIRSPTTGNRLSEPVKFNLMFETHIGPGAETKRRYLRPETAQGVFVNYQRLSEMRNGQLPFATAQIGNAFRNEIAPRSGLLRVREFTMAEIEHFCSPDDKMHSKFADVSGTKLTMYSACSQIDGKPPAECTIGMAVDSGLVANETLGYYLARIQQFLCDVGIHGERLRFRQHMSNEMAHYACDCWDAEVLTSYGWIECVGCADRSAFDLQQHAKATNAKVAGDIIDDNILAELKPHTKTILPHVIEPSFGIGRIMYAVLEHSFNMRPGDDQRCFLSLPPTVAPLKCSILPLSNNIDGLDAVIARIGDDMTAHKIFYRADSSSGSIGRRYARTDEIGIPYAITIDYDTVNKQPPTVTLRERDSMDQLRVPLAKVADTVSDLSTGRLTWSALRCQQQDVGVRTLQQDVTDNCPAAVRPVRIDGKTASLRTAVDSAKLQRQFVYNQSFAIYGQQLGQQDLGPLGCNLKQDILEVWSDFFLMTEQMLQLKCSILTPESVLKSTAYAEDVVAQDKTTGNYFRLDHKLKEIWSKRNVSNAEIAQIPGMTKHELTDKLRAEQYDFTQPTNFSALLCTPIGPTGNVKAFLRPESAHGLYVNFKRLLEFNAGKLPLAAAQIGNVYRNEIAPSADLQRNFEFTTAEFAYFCDPMQMQHPKFGDVRNVQLNVLPAKQSQRSGLIATCHSIGECVDTALVSSETMGYFLARIHLYFQEIGIPSDRVRFRQRAGTALPTDCWDAEVFTNNDWTKCVSCADCGTSVLQQHSTASGVKLTADKTLATPHLVEVMDAIPNKAALRQAHKKEYKEICRLLTDLDGDALRTLKTALDSHGVAALGKFTLNNDQVVVQSSQKTAHVEEIVPNVVHVSFGVSRIMQALLEH